MSRKHIIITVEGGMVAEVLADPAWAGDLLVDVVDFDDPDADHFAQIDYIKRCGGSNAPAEYRSYDCRDIKG